MSARAFSAPSRPSQSVPQMFMPWISPERAEARPDAPAEGGHGDGTPRSEVPPAAAAIAQRGRERVAGEFVSPGTQAPESGFTPVPLHLRGRRGLDTPRSPRPRQMQLGLGEHVLTRGSRPPALSTPHEYAWGRMAPGASRTPGTPGTPGSLSVQPSVSGRVEHDLTERAGDYFGLDGLPSPTPSAGRSLRFTEPGPLVDDDGLLARATTPLSAMGYPPAGADYRPVVASPQALRARRPSEFLLGPNLRRRSWLPLGMLATMLASKPLLFYGVQGAYTHFHDGSALGKGLSVTAIVISYVAYGAALGVAGYDASQLQVSLSRDHRLRHLGGRRQTMVLAGLSVFCPFAIMGAELLMNHGFQHGKVGALVAAHLLLATASFGQVAAWGELYTFMQMRRGWVALPGGPRGVLLGTMGAALLGANLGFATGHTYVPLLAKQLCLYGGLLVSLAGMMQLYSHLSHYGLQNRLTDNAPLPWENHGDMA